MPEEYTREQFWKLYEKLPQELKDALFAEETGNNIHDICERNGILEKLDQLVEYVGQVLLGVLPLDEFQKTLEKELELDPEVAKKVYQEIFRFIFYPVKTSLEELYKTEIAPIAGVPVKPPVKRVTEEKPETSPEEKPEKKPKGMDRYREPIE
jgi:hypothetical protein